jgi:hypothetical protein
MKIGKNSVLLPHLPFSKPKGADGRRVDSATFAERTAHGGWLPLRRKAADRHMPRQAPPQVEVLQDTDGQGVPPLLMGQRNAGTDVDVHALAARMRAEAGAAAEPVASTSKGAAWTEAGRLQVRLPHLTPQHGHTCKPTTLAMLDWYHASRLKLPNIPMHKNRGGRHESQLNKFSAPAAPLQSVRQIAKAHGSLQGEVLESTAMVKIAKDMGYRAETKSPANVDEFGKFVVDQLSNGNPPLAFFAVSKGARADAPFGFPSLVHPEQEHACLIVGIDTRHRTIDIAHWGEVYRRVPIERFHRSMNILAKTRGPETYARTDPATLAQPGQLKYQLVKPGTSQVTLDVDTLRTTGTPKDGTGFNNLVMSLVPDESNARWGSSIADRRRDDEQQAGASGTSGPLGMSDLGGNLALSGLQHNFFIELEGKPAGHAMERPAFDVTARFDRTEQKRRTANKVWGKKGVVPNGWNIQGLMPNDTGPSMLIAKRLYSTKERLQLPGTEGADWVLDARRSKLYQASSEHETAPSVPAAVRQAKAIVRKVDDDGVAEILTEPIGNHWGIRDLGDALTFELPGGVFKLTMPAPSPDGAGVPMQDAERTLVVSAHGQEMPDGPRSTVQIPDGVTVGLFGPPGQVLIGDVIRCTEQRRLHATIRQEAGQQWVDLTASNARDASRYGEISGTEELGRIANLRLQKSGRVSETIIPTRNESGQKDGTTSGPAAYRDTETLREFAFMTRREKAHVLTVRKDTKPTLAEVFDLVTSLKRNGLTYETVLPFACRTDSNDNSPAHNSNHNLTDGSAVHYLRRVAADGALIPIQDAQPPSEVLRSSSIVSAARKDVAEHELDKTKVSEESLQATSTSTSAKPAPKYLDLTDRFLGRQLGDGSMVYRYGNPRSHGLEVRASRDGVLRFEIRARGDRAAMGGGRDMFVSAMQRLETDGVVPQTIMDHWSMGDNDNYNEYVRNLAASMTSQQAARNTWTGRRAAEYGLTHVESVQAIGVGRIKVSFTKPPADDPGS